MDTEKMKRGEEPSPGHAESRFRWTFWTYGDVMAASMAP